VRLSYGDVNLGPTQAAAGGPADTGVPQVSVVPCRPTAFRAVVQSDSAPLRWLAADGVMPGGVLPVGDKIPVLFWGEGYDDGSKPFAERRADGSVVFHADIVAAAFFMLSRWEETVATEKDNHGRFPDSAATACRHGFHDRPIVDEYALILRQWLQRLLPPWKPGTGRFAVKLSHDIDWLGRIWNFRQLVRTLGGDVLRRRSPGRAVSTIKSLAAATAEVTVPESAARFRAIGALAEMSQKYGLESAFYFMAAPRGRFEDGYDLKSGRCRRRIAGLRAQGFEVGLHASYDSFDNAAMLAAQKEQVEKVLGAKARGSRQHRLRFGVPRTWRHLEQAGLEYDTSMSFTETEGFRCGTCHPYRPFDVERDRELGIREVPLVLKDNTLRIFRRLSPAQAEAMTLELARRCKLVEGVFTLCWHNSLLDSDRREWVRTYEQILAGLSRLAAATA
jgi:hypothetical protein